MDIVDGFLVGICFGREVERKKGLNGQEMIILRLDLKRSVKY